MMHRPMLNEAQIESFSKAVEALRRPSGTTAAWQTYACRLVTPLYGGGVRPGEVDLDLPVRASTIRGQLRFWWRIACGPFTSSTAMFEREAGLWGGIAANGPSASRVSVRVSDAKLAGVEPAFRYEPDPRQDAQGRYRSMPTPAPWADAYALFPAQGKLGSNRLAVEEVPKKLGLAGATFTLQVRLAADLSLEQRKEVELALRWWATFGGLGARTRRGLGAFAIDGPSLMAQGQNLSLVSLDEVERRQGLLVIGAPHDSGLAAWKTALARLRTFRQGLRVGRNPPSADTQSPAGRSLWPEADTLRMLSRRSSQQHRERVVKVDGFPRSAFGLPIVFHFKDERQGDPGDHILEPADDPAAGKRDRMASPLILRPYWDGQAWCPAALLLPGWQQVLDQPLKFKGQTAHRPQARPRPADRPAWAQAIAPMRGRGDDALSAFLAFFNEGAVR